MGTGGKRDGRDRKMTMRVMLVLVMTPLTFPLAPLVAVDAAVNASASAFPPEVLPTAIPFTVPSMSMPLIGSS